MQFAHKEFRETQLNKKSFLFGRMQRYDYLSICSILEELITLNTLAKEDEYLKETIYLYTPAYRAIKKYKGIKTLRNKLVAHFNRNENKTFKPYWENMMELNIPITNKEMDRFNYWLWYINSILVTRYFDKLRSISIDYSKSSNEYTSWLKRNEEKNINMTAFSNVTEEIQKRLKEKNIEMINGFKESTDWYKRYY